MRGKSVAGQVACAIPPVVAPALGAWVLGASLCLSPLQSHAGSTAMERQGPNPLSVVGQRPWTLGESRERIARKLAKIDRYDREIKELNEWFARLPPADRAGMWERLVAEITQRGAAIDRLFEEIDALEASRPLATEGLQRPRPALPVLDSLPPARPGTSLSGDESLNFRRLGDFAG